MTRTILNIFLILNVMDILLGKWAAVVKGKKNHKKNFKRFFYIVNIYNI